METTVTRKTRLHVAPYEAVMHSTILSMLDNARDQLKLAREANSSNNILMETKHKNELITTIKALRDITVSAHMGEERMGDIPGLFSYMIDKLTIKYQTRDIHPLTEAWWLLDSLKNVLDHHLSYRKN